MLFYRLADNLGKQSGIVPDLFFARTDYETTREGTLNEVHALKLIHHD